MTNPARQDKAEQIVLAIEAYVKAYVARYIHMSSNDIPVIEARQILADVLATAIR